MHILILLLLILLFVSKNITHVSYSILSNKNTLLYALIEPYFKPLTNNPINKSDSFTGVVSGHREVVYNNKMCFYCRDILML